MVQFKHLASKALSSVNKTLAEYGIEHYIFQQLEATMPDDLYKFIKEDIDLLPLIPDDKKEKIINLAPSIRDWLETALSEQYILETFRKKRPELVGVVINHPNGIIWLRRQIEQIRKTLLNY